MYFNFILFEKICENVIINHILVTSYPYDMSKVDIEINPLSELNILRETIKEVACVINNENLE